MKYNNQHTKHNHWKFKLLKNYISITNNDDFLKLNTELVLGSNVFDKKVAPFSGPSGSCFLALFIVKIVEYMPLIWWRLMGLLVQIMFLPFPKLKIFNLWVAIDLILYHDFLHFKFKFVPILNLIKKSCPFFLTMW